MGASGRKGRGGNTGIASVEVAGRPVPVAIRRSGRARRISLHVQPYKDSVTLVLPRWTPVADGLRFAAEKSAWIGDCLAAMPERVPFVDGSEIPLLGETHRVVATGGRGTVACRDGLIRVPCAPERVDLRVSAWLRVQARVETEARARPMAETIGRKVGRVSVRDTRSRWGSCSSTGNLSFSWRLILAPAFVLDYVVAHEVAHLAEMNHGPGFWRLVERIVGNPEPARAWLRQNGAMLHRYG